MKQPYDFPPGDELQLSFDWSDWLNPGETIIGAVVTPGPNVTLNGAITPSTTAVAINCILNAATPLGTETWVDCRITTNATPARKPSRRLRILAQRVLVEGDPE